MTFVSIRKTDLAKKKKKREREMRKNTQKTSYNK